MYSLIEVFICGGFVTATVDKSDIQLDVVAGIGGR
jgi:hypothetical protein